MNKVKIAKILGLLGALISGAALIAGGSYAEGLGIMAAGFSSADLSQGSP